MGKSSSIQAFARRCPSGEAEPELLLAGLFLKSAMNSAMSLKRYRYFASAGSRSSGPADSD